MSAIVVNCPDMHAIWFENDKPILFPLLSNTDLWQWGDTRKYQHLSEWAGLRGVRGRYVGITMNYSTLVACSLFPVFLRYLYQNRLVQLSKKQSKNSQKRSPVTVAQSSSDRLHLAAKIRAFYLNHPHWRASRPEIGIILKKIPKKCQICAKTNFSSVYGIGKRHFSEGEQNG